LPTIKGEYQGHMAQLAAEQEKSKTKKELEDQKLRRMIEQGLSRGTSQPQNQNDRRN